MFAGYITLMKISDKIRNNGRIPTRDKVLTALEGAGGGALSLTELRKTSGNRKDFSDTLADLIDEGLAEAEEVETGRRPRILVRKSIAALGADTDSGLPSEADRG